MQLQKQVPESLTSKYYSLGLDVPIPLYNGPAMINGKDVKVEIIFDWHPNPRVTCHIETTGTNIINETFEQRQINLHLPNINDFIKVDVFNRNITGGTENRSEITGICSLIELGKGSQLKYVLFHLVNFTKIMGEPIGHDMNLWLGRAEVDFDGWKITIDTVRGYSDLEKKSKQQSGCGITHVARLERIDKSTFSTKQANEVLKALFWFFSFARGNWSPPVLPIGYDVEGNCIWEKWESPRSSPWVDTPAWFCDRRNPSQNLQKALQGFWQKWHDPIWNNPDTNNKPLSIAINWLVASNRDAGGIEGQIVLALTGLELVSWVLLVEDKKEFNRNKFNDQPLAGNIKELLAYIQVTETIPYELSDLDKLSKDRNWQNGPEAITEFRNAIVHPKRRELSRVARWQESNQLLHLASWYLELALLFVIEYDGGYVNRINGITGQWAGEIELVPWSQYRE